MVETLLELLVTVLVNVQQVTLAIIANSLMLALEDQMEHFARTWELQWVSKDIVDACVFSDSLEIIVKLQTPAWLLTTSPTAKMVELLLES